jgi:hypothetical protein
MKVTLIFLFLSPILSHLIFVMPIKVARQADDWLFEKLKEFESTLQAVQNKVDAGGIQSDYVNERGNNVLPALTNKHD